MGEVFGKAFRVLGSCGRKFIGGYKWNKFFIGIFRSTLHSFLLFSPTSLTKSWSFWHCLEDVALLARVAGGIV